MPVRIRLALFAAIGAVVLTSVGGWVFVHQLRNGLHTSVDSSLRTRADALVQTLGDAQGGIDFQDSGTTQLLSARESIAQIMAPDGKVRESSEAAGTRPLLAADALRAARAHTVYSEGHIAHDSNATRFLATPVTRADGKWIVVVGTSLEAADQAVARVRGGVLVGGAIAIALAIGGAWLLGTLALRPVERMRRQAAAISELDAETRLTVPSSHDEIAELGHTVNALLERLQLALTQQRAFVADAGHELRTPLAILRTELELAERPGRRADELRLAIAQAGAETERLSYLTEELLFLARHDEVHATRRRELQPLHPILERAVTAARVHATPRNVDLVLDAPRDSAANVNADDLRRAVDNLLSNAVRYSPPGATVELCAQTTSGALTIAVRDRGPGFPPEFLPHAFERFRRADSARARDEGGNGLGLAIVLAVARAHGGDAEATNRPHGGAQVTIRIPRDHQR
ncbi:MAG: two-component system, OmpR family, sensor kinase [Gaiellaceae bacterium]|nr:two-component system, OmpR family, sensor kinase [Gaiellaceae bacterium]